MICTMKNMNMLYTLNTITNVISERGSQDIFLCKELPLFINYKIVFTCLIHEYF